MQVTSLLSREKHSHDHGHPHHHHDDETCSSCGVEHSHTPVRMKQTLLGLIFVLNAFIVDWLFADAKAISSASGLIGAALLGFPIIMTAVKDLRLGLLSINELVA